MPYECSDSGDGRLLQSGHLFLLLLLGERRARVDLGPRRGSGRPRRLRSGSNEEERREKKGGVEGEVGGERE